MQVQRVGDADHRQARALSAGPLAEVVQHLHSSVLLPKGLPSSRLPWVSELNRHDTIRKALPKGLNHAS